jgi:hypothetical protein
MHLRPLLSVAGAVLGLVVAFGLGCGREDRVLQVVGSKEGGLEAIVLKHSAPPTVSDRYRVEIRDSKQPNRGAVTVFRGERMCAPTVRWMGAAQEGVQPVMWKVDERLVLYYMDGGRLMQIETWPQLRTAQEQPMHVVVYLRATPFRDGRLAIPDSSR